jgi:hypothetical protein
MIPNTQAPPLPPSISQQQMPQMTAMQQFAQGMSGAAQPQAMPAADGQGGSNEYVVSNMKQVELLLTDVAKTLTVTNPEIMPYLKIMAQAGSKIMESVMDAQGGVAQAPAGSDGSQGGDPQASMMA